MELPLLDGFNHAAEVSVAVRDSMVLVAGINLKLDGPDSFDTQTLTRGVATWISGDEGETFAGPLALEAEHQTADPVVRFADTGVPWLTVLNSENGDVVLLSGADPHEPLAVVAGTLPGFDKPWMAIDDIGSSVYICAATALSRVAFDGTLLAREFQGVERCLSGYADDAGFHYLTIGAEVYRWDGDTEPVLEIPALDPGELPTFFTTVAGSIGPTSSGIWIVRAMRNFADAPIVLERWEAGQLVRRDLTDPGATAFLPAAAMDESGRLHVVWYETSGPQGILRYTRSESGDLDGPFLPAVTIDPEACPGSRWYPAFGQDPVLGGRRLREYIEIAVRGTRAHIAWTHAPGPPARIRTTYVDYD